MLVVHHLENSRSQLILRLLEGFGVVRGALMQMTEDDSDVGN